MKTVILFLRMRKQLELVNAPASDIAVVDAKIDGMMRELSKPRTKL